VDTTGYDGWPLAQAAIRSPYLKKACCTLLYCVSDCIKLSPINLFRAGTDNGDDGCIHQDENRLWFLTFILAVFL
jgi:hypothetical protein